MTATRAAADHGRRLADSRALRVLARSGLAAQGLIFLLVGLLAVRVASGSGSTPDQSGALAEVAKQPFGHVLLVTIAVALFGFALSQLTDVIRGVPGEGAEGRQKMLPRVGAGCVAVAYGALGVTAIKIAVGAGSAGTSSSSSRSGAAGLLGLPGGRFLVGVIGLIVVGVGGYSLVKGVRGKFVERMQLGELGARARTAVVTLGRVGHVARGATFIIVGVLVIVAAVQYEPQKAGGLDAALTTLARQPFGPALLSVVALGLVCFGLFCFADARYRRL